MYSPKVPERLVPTLYHLARTRGLHMTSLVAEALDRYVAAQDLTTIADLIAASEHRRGLLTPRTTTQTTRRPVSRRAA